jgi:hypothetical protein
MDTVHLKPSGHRVVAEVLEPVVRALADQPADGAPRAPGSRGR